MKLIKEIIQISNSENSKVSDIFNSARSQFNICAWYCPIHYYSYDWGIYIKEDCIKMFENTISEMSSGK